MIPAPERSITKSAVSSPSIPVSPPSPSSFPNSTGEYTEPNKTFPNSFISISSSICNCFSSASRLFFFFLPIIITKSSFSGISSLPSTKEGSSSSASFLLPFFFTLSLTIAF
uniref:Uncharacterized protein n=1 Tax=Opuntia streptacantha TaxID=393608 RepID=A0A7C9AJH8_OPUST